MKFPSVVAVCGLGILLAGCSGSGGSEASGVRASLGCEEGTLDATVTHVDLEHDGRARSYEIHVPPSYDGVVPLPVIVNFHGLTSTGLAQQENSEMDTTADREGFIVAYPNGIGGSWNIGGGCCGRAAEENVDDVGFARAVIEDLGARGCIDTRRVYATGMSNGGFFTHTLACEAADVVAAAAPVAALLDPDAACAPSRPIPIILFNGTADPLVPYDGGGPANAPSAADTTEGWLTRNGCTGEPAVSYQNGDATCETVDRCEGGSSVTLCTIEGAGHCWPGYPCRLQGLGEPTFDIDANEAMWGLFSTVKLP
jgi:polyhydroxybutyrate depolymerase